MSALRPLPPQPSLEFERKEAKALLQRLRTGDAEALERARARHPAIAAKSPADIRLADAQLVIAREYGFTSWPRLVRYFTELERQRHNDLTIQSTQPESYERRARSLLAAHRERRESAWRSLAAYVPRFYGQRAHEVFATAVTEDEARLAVARSSGFPSWEVMRERISARHEMTRIQSPWEVDPMRKAAKTMKARDLEELKRLVETYPDLLRPTEYDAAKGRNLLNVALGQERQLGVEAMRPVMEWLTSLGLDLQRELNMRLLGHLRMDTETVRWLLDRGADPDWVAPNGYTALEHAIVRYWNGEAVELVAARSTPRQALWVAAGLGDVDGVSRFLDARGRPTAKARRDRPDLVALGSGGYVPQHPDAGDEEILMEAFLPAVLNGRCNVMQYMVSRGFPVDSRVWGMPMIHIAIGNFMTSAVECLIRCGADLELPAGQQGQTPRQFAQGMFEHFSDNADARRIVELCGLDPEAILSASDARPLPSPSVQPKLQEALELAGDDAFRLGQSEIGAENLLFGLLRRGGMPQIYFADVSQMDKERFYEDWKDRLQPASDRLERPKLPMSAEARAAIEEAIAIGAQRRRDSIHGLHLLYALTRSEKGIAADLLARYGSSAAQINTELKKER